MCNFENIIFQFANVNGLQIVMHRSFAMAAIVFQEVIFLHSIILFDINILIKFLNYF